MLSNLLEVSRDDFVRNADIRDMLRQAHASLKLRRVKMKRLGRVERMGEELQMKQIIQIEMQRRWPRGRLRIKWKDAFRIASRVVDCVFRKLPLKPWTVTIG